MDLKKSIIGPALDLRK